jgi:hypothetical protein
LAIGNWQWQHQIKVPWQQISYKVGPYSKKKFQLLRLGENEMISISPKPFQC